MTLIAAFRTRGGVAICADSQETSSTMIQGQPFELRKKVEKLTPLIFSEYHVLIAGGGDARYVEIATERVRRAFGSEQGQGTIQRAHAVLEKALEDVYQKDARGIDPGIKFFFGVSCPKAKAYEVWVSDLHLLRPMREVEMVGWDHEFYHVTAQRLYRPAMTPTQALLAAVQVLSVAEETSNCTKGPFSAGAVLDRGIVMEDEGYIRDLVDRLRTFERMTNQILLLSADTSIPVPILESSLEDFGKVAVDLHKQIIEQLLQKPAGMRTLITGLDKVPPGLKVVVHQDGSRTVHHEAHPIREFVREINEAIERGREVDDSTPSTSHSSEDQR